jgi:hypothetical protein
VRGQSELDELPEELESEESELLLSENEAGRTRSDQPLAVARHSAASKQPFPTPVEKSSCDSLHTLPNPCAPYESPHPNQQLPNVSNSSDKLRSPPKKLGLPPRARKHHESTLPDYTSKTDVCPEECASHTQSASTPTSSVS